MSLPLSIPARYSSRWALALWPLILSLVACGQLASAPIHASTDAPTSASTSTLCESSSHAEAASLRLLVSFHQPTVGDTPLVLARLQAEAGACVRHVFSASTTLHAYVVDTTADMADVGTRLLRWSAVKAVEVDALVRRH